MTLPYDVARCAGQGLATCPSCRRQEPGDPQRQVFNVPRLEYGACIDYIPQERKDTKASDE